MGAFDILAQTDCTELQDIRVRPHCEFAAVNSTLQDHTTTRLVFYIMSYLLRARQQHRLSVLSTLLLMIVNFV